VSYQSPFDWTSWDLSALIKKDKPPRSVRNAVKLMYAGAGIEALRLIVGLAAYFSFWRGLTSVSALQITPGQWQLAEDSGAGILIVTCLTRMGMWVWMASKSNAGRNWARILSTVFLVIDSLGLVLGIAEPIRIAWPVLLPVAIWLVGVWTVVLLWQQESSQFFTLQSRS
jgi:hypothetical protein